MCTVPRAHHMTCSRQEDAQWTVRTSIADGKSYIYRIIMQIFIIIICIACKVGSNNSIVLHAYLIFCLNLLQHFASVCLITLSIQDEVCFSNPLNKCKTYIAQCTHFRMCTCIMHVYSGIGSHYDRMRDQRNSKWQFYIHTYTQYHYTSVTCRSRYIHAVLSRIVVPCTKYYIVIVNHYTITLILCGQEYIRMHSWYGLIYMHSCMLTNSGLGEKYGGECWWGRDSAALIRSISLQNADSSTRYILW